jgi:hypothetical protein
MIDHVIVFKAEDIDEATERELIARLGELVRIPGIAGFALGKNFGNRSRGFDYCLRVTFADREALDRYEAHPIHLDVVAYNRAVTSEHLCVDFAWEPLPEGSAP